MKFGICLLSIVPGRAEASDKSEMVTQLLFGDLVKIQSLKEKWVKVKIINDSYVCWVDRQQIVPLSEKDFNALSSSAPLISEDILTPVNYLNKNQLIPIVLGSKIYHFDEKDSKSKAGEFNYEINGHLRKIPTEVDRHKLVEDAFLYLNAPYLWGGKSPLGIDCSGFVQMVYALNGIQLPRDAYRQAELGQPLSFIEEAEEGDLAFFDNEEGRITHVGIILKDHRIIHASGKVRVDRMDHQGIYRNESKDYSHKLRIIKKIF